MTDRPYRLDPYRTEFEAEIVEAVVCQGQPSVVLDKTYFYPTSGGQPHDLGTLNQVPVVDVIEENDRILHVLAAPLANGPVHGQIDWPRRFDHMQQHSGQHILSQAWLRVANAATVSFHLGAETCTIDLALGQCEDALADAVEDVANQAIWDDLPVIVHEYRREDLAELELRKLPAINGPVRVVSIGAFDVTACGGTHVHTTGEVGSIHIQKYEKRHGQVRIEFVCGRRATIAQRMADRLVQHTAGLLSIHSRDLPLTVSRLMDESKKHQKKIDELYGLLLEAELPVWLKQAELFDSRRIIAKVIEFPAALLHQAAQELTVGPDVVALLVSLPPSTQVCFACSINVPVHMGNLLRTVVMQYGGKGGGTQTIAQGGGVRDKYLEALLTSALEELKVKLGCS